MTKPQDIFERLRAEGKATVLSDEQVAEIDKRLNKEMAAFRAKLRRIQAQSEADLARIVLTS